MALDNREFEVELIVTTHHLFTTFSRSAEEAVSDAENMLEDGDDGDVVSQVVESADAYPLDELTDDDDEDDEEETDITEGVDD
jgi:hypothetical protein